MLHCIAGARLLLQFASAQLREDFEAAAASPSRSSTLLQLLNDSTPGG